MLPIAGKTAGLFGLTFFGHSGVTGGCSRLKNYYFFPKKVQIFSRATLGYSASYSKTNSGIQYWIISRY